MTDQPERPDQDATQPIAGPGTPDDLLAAPPAGVGAPPQLTARPGPSGSLPKSTLAMLGVALLVVGGVGGALIGHTVGTSDTQQTAGGRFARGFPGAGQGGAGQGDRAGAGPGGAGAGVVVGTVTAVDGDTVTIKEQGGRTVSVKLSDSTAITVTKPGSSSDVTVDEQVMATGQAGSDGTVTARNLRIGDQAGFGFRGAGGPGGTGNG